MKNIPTQIDGQTSLDAEDFNQIPDELENTIIGSGQTLDGNDLNQIGKALTTASCLYNYYNDTGTVNNIVLNAVNRQPLISYVDGMQVRFYTANANTGTTTINIDGLGAKNVVLYNNTSSNVPAGVFLANYYYDVVYNVTLDKFVLTSLESILSSILDPVGTIIYYYGATPPNNYLALDGTAWNKTTYSELYNVVSGQDNVTETSTTFSLPDFSNYFIRNLSSSRNVGETQTDAIRNITGTYTAQGFSTQNEGTGTGALLKGGDSAIDSRAGSGTYEKMGIEFDASRVVPTDTENRPINITVLACIKYTLGL